MARACKRSWNTGFDVIWRYPQTFAYAWCICKSIFRGWVLFLLPPTTTILVIIPIIGFLNWHLTLLPNAFYVWILLKYVINMSPIDPCAGSEGVLHSSQLNCHWYSHVIFGFCNSRGQCKNGAKVCGTNWKLHTSHYAVHSNMRMFSVSNTDRPQW